jgi:hypothetical protein
MSKQTIPQPFSPLDFITIAPELHGQFVQEFALNMINTLTDKQVQQKARKRTIYSFDERGGVFGIGSGQQGQQICDYRNLTTGVFHEPNNNIVGVRYRCEPEALKNSQAIGAFHTHPALFTPDIKLLRRRIERLLWLSEMDIEAFKQQRAYFKYDWHFVACVDIAAFYWGDIESGCYHPRFIFRYPHLEQLVETIHEDILHIDGLLKQEFILDDRPVSAVIQEVSLLPVNQQIRYLQRCNISWENIEAHRSILTTNSYRHLKDSYTSLSSLT